MRQCKQRPCIRRKDHRLGATTVTAGFRNRVVIARILGALSLAFAAGTAQAQAADDFDASATTTTAVGIVCGQNLSFGRAYVGTSNSLSVVSLTSGASLNSNHASVVVSGSAIGQCTISGLQGPDTISIVLSGAAGSTTLGGLTGVTLSDGASHTLTATIQIGVGATPVQGGRGALTNGIIPVYGTVTIPASHADFGTYTATLTATTFLN
jgi:hypothetical protein